MVNSSPAIRADDLVKQWLSGHREALRLRLVKRFNADLAKGDLSPGSHAKTMARLVMALAGGIAVEAQSGATRKELYAMVELALRALNPE